MMQKSDITIRTIELNDLDGALRLSTDQGWNQTIADWRMMIENPQNSCLLAEWQKKIIGTTTAINYSNEVAWISMVLVDKEFRGHGVSKLLLEVIFEKLMHCKSIKLDATPEGQPVYMKYHFADEYFITRMTCEHYPVNSHFENEAILQPVQQKDIFDISTKDQYVFGANRHQLIDYLISLYPNRAWMLKLNHSITGYALGRAGRKYNHIGPVMAASLNDAKLLISKSLTELHHQPVVMDVLNDKTEMIDWLSMLGFIKQRTFVRMYQYHNPSPGKKNHQFLIGGPEFG